MKYKIIDILHTGHHGPRNESKVGSKYDYRRGQIIEIDMDEYNLGDVLLFERDGLPFLFTTPFMDAYEVDGKFYIETMNSIYVMEKIDE